MRPLLVVVLATATAAARPVAQESADWATTHLDAAILGDRVDVSGVWFADAACMTAFGKPIVVDSSADREALARCLWADGIEDTYRLGDRTVVVLPQGQAIELGLHHGRVVRIGPVGATKSERAITLDRGVDSDFVPSASVRAAVERSDAGITEAVYKVCRDDRRILSHSPNDAFDREADAYARKLTPSGGAGVDSCDLVFLRYPNIDFETGLAYNAATLPAKKISAADLMSQHIAGDKHIEPDDVTKTEIMRSGKERLVTIIDLCIDNEGRPSALGMSKSSGFPAFDAKLQREMRDWRFKPFASAVCAPITFMYVQY